MLSGRSLVPALAALLLGACGATEELPPGFESRPLPRYEPPPPRAVTERVPWLGTKTLHWEREVLRYPDGTEVRDGREREWFRDGTLQAERFFDHGEPTGTWRTFWPDGSRRSWIDHRRGEPSPVRWWHESGELSAEGTLVGGTRHGPWVHFHENGERAEQGSYAGGFRDGRWRYWDESGRLREEGRYAGGHRVGPWSFWDASGDLVVKQGPLPVDAR